MPTKTASILANLPFTFLAATRRSALQAIAGSVGSELSSGEVALARILRAHWVDTADRNAPEIDDLARIGSMWGLAPLRDNDGEVLESIEQFREHLKRHVATLIQGTVTVPGILRLASDILGIHADTEGVSFDPWWARKHDVLTSFEPRGEDAAERLFGRGSADVAGADAEPARIVGKPSLSTGVQLGEARTLRVQVDEHGPFDIDLAGGTETVTLDQIVTAINAKFPAQVARHDGSHLILESIVKGPEGRVEIEDQDRDAAPAILGLPALIYTGRDSTQAQITSKVDLSAGVDLSGQRYLRLVIDGKDIAEIDCAGADPSSTVLDEIRDKINAAFGRAAATHNGQFLIIRSALTGAQSSLFLQQPAAQDCSASILGISRAFFLGTDAAPAVASGAVHIAETVDLSNAALVRLRVDTAPPVTVNCAGASPSKTTLQEIVTILNAALGPGTAFTDGRKIVLMSHQTGRHGQIVFESAGEHDALDVIFGFRIRVFNGSGGLPASITGNTDLSGHNRLWAEYLVGIAVDGGEAREIDLRTHVVDLDHATPEEMVATINAKYPGVAFTDGRHLLLTSQTVGSNSRIEVVPLETKLVRRFTSRAMILDEASQIVLGLTVGTAFGESASIAVVRGEPDLQFGVDLRDQPWLMLEIDGHALDPINCAGPRPRATTIGEALGKIREKLTLGTAISDGHHLILASPSAGAGSSVRFLPVTVQDASIRLLGSDLLGERRGEDATQVVFVSTVDLSKGVELAPDARVKLGIDGSASVEIPLNAGTTPVKKSAGEIAAAINLGLNAPIASQDGRTLTISSRKKGSVSQIQFDTPGGTDSTKAVFGIDAARFYQASDATRGEIRGTKTIGTVDVSLARFLNVSVDGKPAKTINCSTAAKDPANATLEEVVTSLNTAIGALAAASDGKLALHSNTRGSASRIEVQPYVAGDARQKLFGAVPDVTRGSDPLPAQLKGSVSLLDPADLFEHRNLLISVDRRRPVEIDLSGEQPQQTGFDEIIENINGVLPGVASLAADGTLLLTSPSVGEASSIEILPRRYLELIEYPPETSTEPPAEFSHGQQFTIHNSGAADSSLRIILYADRGVVDPAFVNEFAGVVVGVKEVIRPGATLIVEWSDSGAVQARIESPLSPVRSVDSGSIEIQKTHGNVAVTNPLLVPRGQSEWTYLECTGSRFNEADFDVDSFAGLPCISLGIFDVSLWDGTGVAPTSIFWPPPPPPDPSVRLAFEWVEYRSGSFDLNLPAELPPVFGGHFNEARLGLGRKSEVFENVVFEPEDDPDYIVDKINEGSTIVEANDALTNVPLGFSGQTVPFRKPKFLTLGDDRKPAAIYLLEEGLEGTIEVKAREPGDWGNRVSVSVRPSGPARYQVEIYFEGDRFEGARNLVLAGEQPLIPPPPDPNLPACAKKPLAYTTVPAPGVEQAKAAGIRARVKRSRAE